MTISEAGRIAAAVLPALRYKPGWTFKIGGPGSRFLCVFAETVDSVRQDRKRTTQHMFEIPDVADDREFLRWVRDCLLLAERHECCEFIEYQGRRPFFPHHQDEGSPYELVETWSRDGT